MLPSHVAFITLTISVILVCQSNGFPTTSSTSNFPLSTATHSVQNQKIPLEDIQLLHPHIVTIERLESLLRRAGEIFETDADDQATKNVQPTTTTTTTTAREFKHLAVPYQQMQPPTAQSFNYYLPLFETNEHTKLDAKSRQMEKFLPPPVPKKDEIVTDYYVVKPKKTPKKFNAAEKHINIKWLNTMEHEALESLGGEMPLPIYVANDERNRINFQDSFFDADMQVKETDNNMKLNNGGGQDAGDELNEEDLIATPTILVPQIKLKLNFSKNI